MLLPAAGCRSVSACENAVAIAMGRATVLALEVDSCTGCTGGDPTEVRAGVGFRILDRVRSEVLHRVGLSDLLS